MSSQYQLPCPACQKVIQVTTTQAGETLDCACGEQVVVPTLREIRQLAPVEDAAPQQAPAPTWNTSVQAMFAIGLVLIMIAGIGHWRIAPRRSELRTDRPNVEAFKIKESDLKKVSLDRAWSAWKTFRDVSLETREFTPVYLKNQELHRELSIYLYFFWGLGIVGLLLTAGAVATRYAPHALAKKAPS